MLKIRISYSDREQADMVLGILRPLLPRAKIRESEKGKHKKLYIEARECAPCEVEGCTQNQKKMHTK